MGGDESRAAEAGRRRLPGIGTCKRSAGFSFDCAIHRDGGMALNIIERPTGGGGGGFDGAGGTGALRMSLSTGATAKAAFAGGAGCIDVDSAQRVGCGVRGRIAGGASCIECVAAMSSCGGADRGGSQARGQRGCAGIAAVVADVEMSVGGIAAGGNGLSRDGAGAGGVDGGVGAGISASAEDGVVVDAAGPAACGCRSGAKTACSGDGGLRSGGGGGGPPRRG